MLHPEQRRNIVAPLVSQDKILALNERDSAASAGQDHTQEGSFWEPYAKSRKLDFAVEALPEIFYGLLPDIWFDAAGQDVICNENYGCYAQRESRAGEPNFLPAQHSHLSNENLSSFQYGTAAREATGVAAVPVRSRV
jgi:hypothetical protein